MVDKLKNAFTSYSNSQGTQKDQLNTNTKNKFANSEKDKDEMVMHLTLLFTPHLLLLLQPLLWYFILSQQLLNAILSCFNQEQL